MKYSLVILFLIFCNINYPQDTQATPDDNKLLLNPIFFGVQFDITTILFIYQYGGQLDYDLFSATNKFHNIGIRLSIEHYHSVSIGGTTLGSPFTNYNLLLRHSLRGNVFWFDLVGGLTYYNTSASKYYPDEVLLRAGFELSYHLFHNIIGIILKGSTPFKERTGFIGLGISIGFYKN